MPEVVVTSFDVKTQEKGGGVLVVALIGEFDLAGFEEVDELLAAAQSDSNRSVVVDLRGLTFIDSSGIRALIRAGARAEATGSSLRLIRGVESVHRIFVVTGIDTQLPFAEDG